MSKFSRILKQDINYSSSLFQKQNFNENYIARYIFPNLFVKYLHMVNKCRTR